MKNGTNENSDIKVSDIDATLNYGQIFTDKIWNFILIFILVCSCLILVCGIALLIIEKSNNEYIYVGSAMCGFGVILLLTVIALFLFINRGKKKVKVLLEDAVVLEANSVSIGTVPLVRIPFIFSTAVAIRITFNFNGLSYVRESNCKGKITYLKIYSKYADKKIYIAYSPIYDEVMLLKKK